jgi:lysozyme
MKTSKKGIDLIKKYEGFVSKPYLCPAKVPTIGFGATYYADGRQVSMKDDPITQAAAIDLLKNMLTRYENAVNRYVQTEINQNQFDALVSFAYNLGCGALQKSTLLKKINNDPCDPDIHYQFKRWVRANGIILDGLVKRRKSECDLYFS